MNVLYIPQRNDNWIEYEYSGEVITVTYEGVTDTIDLSPLRTGDTLRAVETELDIDPVISAERRQDGILYVELVYHHGKDATEEERFPEWVSIDG